MDEKSMSTMRKQILLSIPITLLFLIPLLSHARSVPNLGSVLGTATQCPNLTRDLSYGMRGSDVKQLQQFLIAQNLLAAGNDTGYFGPATLAAVQTFQRQEKVVSPWAPGYGRVGPVTRAAIARVCAGGGYGSQPCSFNNQPVLHTASVTAYQSSSVPHGQQCVSERRLCTNGSLSGSYQYANCSQTTAATPACTLAANPTSVQSGSSSTLTLASTNATSATIDQGIGSIAVNGTKQLTNITATKTYTATVSGAGGSVQCQATVTVAPAPGGPVVAPTGLTASCNATGNQVTLTWNASANAANYGIRIIPDGASEFFKIEDWYVGTSYTVAVTPNKRYSWWVHANPAVGTLGPHTTGTGFICGYQSPLMPPVAQTTILNGERPDPAGFTPDFYSAELVKWGSGMRMYFGGWYELAPPDYQDDIYVSDCPYTGGPCTNVRKVIDASQYGGPVNDPSVVLIDPADGSKDYYIMYMTCVVHGAPTGGVCYSTSWADDGINWGKPGLLVANAWLPSASIKDGHVILYLSRHPSNELLRYDLGTSGVAVGTPDVLKFTGLPAPLGGNAFYINIDARWRPTLNAYQMLAEGPDTTDGAWPWPSAIDYLDSTDGINWRVVYTGVVRRTSDQARIGTPGQHPDSAAWVYFGSTARDDSAGFKINFAQWNSPN